MVLGLAIGGGVLFVLLIIVGIVIFISHRRRGDRDRDHDSTVSPSQMQAEMQLAHEIRDGSLHFLEILFVSIY